MHRFRLILGRRGCDWFGHEIAYITRNPLYPRYTRLYCDRCRKHFYTRPHSDALIPGNSTLSKTWRDFYQAAEEIKKFESEHSGGSKP